VEQKNEVTQYIQNISLFLLGILLIAFPIVFTTISTNPIILPKQILLGGIVVILLILQTVKMFAEKSVKLRRTSFDIPILLLAILAFASAMFAVNKADALTAFFPYLFSILAFFLIVNIAKDKNSLLFLMSSQIAGAILLSVSADLSFFKVYILPLSETHARTFTPLGSSLEQEIYLILTLTMSSYYLYRFLKSKVKSETETTAESKMTNQEMTKALSFGVASFIILTGIIVTTYSLFKLDKPLILPVQTGFQTAFSEISLDAGRIAQGFLVGSGFGTYATDFSRWKQASFNQDQNLWNLSFFRSSSWALELLATTGILGLCSFIFLLIRVFKEARISPQNKILISTIGLLLASLLLPLDFTTQTLFFVILGLFAANQGLISKAQNRFFDIELQLVTFRKGLIAMEVPHSKNEKSLILPSFTAIIILALIGVIGYFSIPYIDSDLTFQRSLLAAAKNNGSLTYSEQGKAISTFQYRDGFYRVFSQTNLALANTLASQQPAGSTPSQAVQGNITTLIQQSINAARNAVTVAPQTYLNWQNLSSVYRGLIGFGQNAESFAVASAQQSISLDPSNPQEYIALGGIFYQLQQWDNAQNQFQLAITLKPDYANSHYNLGHVLEQKGDSQNALAQYQAVRTLVAGDKASLMQIDKEIAALEGKTKAPVQTKTENIVNPNPILDVNKPGAKLPAQNPPVKIPAPNVTGTTPVSTSSSK
jgi:tetratricopeptide (TPR) repeat protein